MIMKEKHLKSIAIVAGACFAGATMGVVVAGYEGMIFGATMGIVIGCAWHYFERRVL